jgi:hypothetical protein
MRDGLLAGQRNRLASARLVCVEGVEPWAPGRDLLTRGDLEEVNMTHWHDSMVDRPETDGAAYTAGWTLSGLAVLGVIVAVWVLGI